MKKEYKELFDSIEPSEELTHKVLHSNGRAEHKSFSSRRLIAVAAAFAIAVTGSAFTVCQLNIHTEQGETDPSVADSHGFAIVAYAKEGDSNVRNISDKIYTPVRCQIVSADIRNKSESEIESTMKQLGNEYDASQFNESLYRSVQRLDNAIVGMVVCDFFDISIDNPADVQSITVSCDSDYGEMEIVSMEKHYDDDGNIVLEFDEPEQLKNDFIKGKSVSISGDRFEKAKSIDAPFEINWKMSHKLYEEIDNNPDFDLSAIKDEIKFEVLFKNGSTAQSIMQISFDSDGKMSTIIKK